MRTARFQADAYQRVSAAARYAPTVQDSFFSLQLQVRGDDLYLIGGLVLLQPVVQGKAIGRVALGRLGVGMGDPELVEPLYVRPPDAKPMAT